MEMNLTTTTAISLIDSQSFNKSMRLINLALSCSGVLTNLVLFILLVKLHRHQCTTYFLLILMIICDCLYCLVYTSILLTIDYYLNVINHQILCPLSFFLTPFTFTGSTLLLLICLLHVITNYVRRYDTIFGQIGGRLSAVFVFAFIIIRSVLGSTSIELISDSLTPTIQHCTIDMNTPEIVRIIQNINHIFADVTDILVYIGWIIFLIIYLISYFNCKNKKCDGSSSSSSDENGKKRVSFLAWKKNQSETNLLSINQQRLTNKQRHNDISLIILSISLISILLYFPVMFNKYITMNLIYRHKFFIDEQKVYLLQIIQQTTHLFCLTIRFIPYCLFDKRIKLIFNQIVGIKIQRKKSSKNNTYLQKYICHCQCCSRQK